LLGGGLLDATTLAATKAILRQINRIPIDPAWFDLDAFVAAIRKNKKQLREALTATQLDAEHRLRLVHTVQVAEGRKALALVLAPQPRAL
jgi:hypothetical protein